ncbi:type II secretion system minor pseudopilin GspK [Sansalvadorimonas sp. 2012CJ34-2]|uniref:Type II secretion system protein K n=1 Tax=Parendozoicomonas callyspongiae TaxID=2942213 RepID=A0ABT0PBK3_9GAMM|nr:type II secretion system minor pseudopilin GspK [Sansalvadorimonas sp. 2012CJ34-2]MCL6268745.1 type II secretion system minor pseudopilin GspK [Sansalvadorimonas sp. 2012CJ34-2]
MSKKNQHGLALLSVLLTLTLAMLLASGIAESLQRQVRVSQGLQSREQGWQYALSSEQLAVKVLNQDFKDEKESVHLGQTWATGNQTFSVDRGQISGDVVDMQGCLNLNALAHDDAVDKESGKKETPLGVKVLAALLENLEVDSYTAESIVQATRDWVFPKTIPVAASGADDDEYLALPVAYLAGNTDMRDKSEWRAVKGVTPERAVKALPFLCTIPESELQLNINTVPEDQPELMAAILLNRVDTVRAKDILAQRPRDGWRDVDEFLALSQVAAIKTDDIKQALKVNSRFFEVRSRIQVGNTETRINSLMVRGSKDKLTVIRRRTGEV